MNPLKRHRLISLSLYLLFAGICAWVQGWQPDLHIDHLAYIKRADTLLAQFPNGDYWRGFEARNTYATLMAWLYGWTGSHILSLKLLLAIMTLGWLAGLEWWFARLSLNPYQARIAALLGGIHINFGAPQWGVSSFEDSLHRTLVMPILFVVLGWYWQQRTRPARLLALPVAAGLCLVHLGSAYLLAVLVVVELWSSLSSSRQSPGPLLLSLSTAALILIMIQLSGLAITPEAANRLVPTISGENLLKPQIAWAVEFAALRWRNFPPTIASLAATAASAGPLIFFGLLGRLFSPCRFETIDSDRFMQRFALAAIIVAFSWQACLAVLRHLLPIYPLNFEEIRTIAWIIPPLIYFGIRGFEGDAKPWLRPLLLTSIGFVIVQPAQLVKFLPEKSKLSLLEIASPAAADTPNDLIRARIARQWLGITRSEPRLYYDALGVIAWLHANATPQQRVLTDRDECRLAPTQVIGIPTGFLNVNPRQHAALAWLNLTRELQVALMSQDMPRLVALAQSNHADYIVMTGRVPNAIYVDRYFSIIKVPPPQHS